VDRKVHHRRDHDDAAVREHAIQFAHRLARKLDVLERVERERSTDAGGGQIEFVKIQHAVDSRAFAHVAAHVLLAGEQGAQIHDALLAGGLEGAEFVDRTGKLQHAGGPFDEILDVASHTRRASLHHPGLRNKR
jgi:hypothetical protein